MIASELEKRARARGRGDGTRRRAARREPGDPTNAHGQLISYALLMCAAAAWAVVDRLRTSPPISGVSTRARTVADALGRAANVHLSAHNMGHNPVVSSMPATLSALCLSHPIRRSPVSLLLRVEPSLGPRTCSMQAHPDWPAL